MTISGRRKQGSLGWYRLDRLASPQAHFLLHTLSRPTRYVLRDNLQVRGFDGSLPQFSRREAANALPDSDSMAGFPIKEPKEVSTSHNRNIGVVEGDNALSTALHSVLHQHVSHDVKYATDFRRSPHSGVLKEVRELNDDSSC